MTNRHHPQKHHGHKHHLGVRATKIRICKARAIGMIMKGVTVVAGMTTMMFGIIPVMLAKAKVVNVMTIGTEEVMIEAAAE